MEQDHEVRVQEQAGDLEEVEVEDLEVGKH
jgi:hypothetical protein